MDLIIMIRVGPVAMENILEVVFLKRMLTV